MNDPILLQLPADLRLGMDTALDKARQDNPLYTVELFLHFAVENATAMLEAQPTILTDFARHRARQEAALRERLQAQAARAPARSRTRHCAPPPAAAPADPGRLDQLAQDVAHLRSHLARLDARQPSRRCIPPEVLGAWSSRVEGFLDLAPGPLYVHQVLDAVPPPAVLTQRSAEVRAAAVLRRRGWQPAPGPMPLYSRPAAVPLPAPADLLAENEQLRAHLAQMHQERAQRWRATTSP